MWQTTIKSESYSMLAGSEELILSAKTAVEHLKLAYNVITQEERVLLCFLSKTVCLFQLEM